MHPTSVSPLHLKRLVAICSETMMYRIRQCVCSSCLDSGHITNSNAGYMTR
jgi:hypothetical protein